VRHDVVTQPAARPLNADSRGNGDLPMYTHAPEGYRCPFCRLFAGEDLGPNGSTPNDILYRDDRVAAIMATKWWRNTRGHVLVVPVAHFENIYDLPPAFGHDIQRVARDVALAMKRAYGCEGISTRQHNEPAGMQSVWHFHLHVYPRYRRDLLNLTWGRGTTAAQRKPYADRLRAALHDLQAEGASDHL
jgi:histidine triad (HIT) family protein